MRGDDWREDGVCVVVGGVSRSGGGRGGAGKEGFALMLVLCSVVLGGFMRAVLLVQVLEVAGVVRGGKLCMQHLYNIERVPSPQVHTILA